MDKIDNKFMGLVAVFFLVFGLFTINVFFGPNIREIRARAAVPSPAKSSLFSSARTLSIAGTDKATISVFLRAEDGNGVGNTPVSVTTTVGTIVPTESTTDASGIANFFLTCNAAGVAQISASSKGVAVGNTVTVACQ